MIIVNIQMRFSDECYLMGNKLHYSTYLHNQQVYDSQAQG